MTNFDRDYLFLDDDHISYTVSLFNLLDKRDNEQRFDDDFQTVPAFLFLSGLVVEDIDFDQITIESLYESNKARCKSSDKDVSDISRTANEFYDGSFRLSEMGALDSDYQVMVKNALDILYANREIYDNKLSKMVEKMIDFTNQRINQQESER
jgi:hypothetical protein